MIEEEVWVPISGYEGLYEISNFGLVKSKRRHGTRGGIAKQHPTELGYMRVRLAKDGKGKTFVVHRLVAKAFIPNPKNKKTVNHLDGDKTNNRVSNLEWATHGENQRHAYATGLREKNNPNLNGLMQGEKLPQSKLTDDCVRYIRKHARVNGGKYTTIELGKKFGVDSSTISRVARKEWWRHVI